MAISYTGPRGSTYQLSVNDNGVKKTIYLQTKMVELQPTLKTTNFLNLIKNTAGVGMYDANTNTRYYYNIKEEGELDVIYNSEGLKIDPRTLDVNEFSVEAKQLAPITRAKKFGGYKADLKIQGLENVVAIKMADYINQVRLEDQRSMMMQAMNAAANFQEDNLNEYTTFEEGAHFVINKQITDGNDAHDHLCEALDNFQRLGSKNAAQEINQKLPHCNGVPLSDMVIVASNSFTTKLKKVPGVFAGPMGNEIFMKNGIDMVEGVPYIATSQLPKDVHFIILTTGNHGAIAYEECGTITEMTIAGKSQSVMNHQIVMVDDPNWTGCYRIDYSSTIKKDILFPDLIFVSSAAKSLPTKRKMINKQIKDGTFSVEDARTVLNSYKTKLNTSEENIKALDEQISKLVDSLKENGVDKESIKASIASLKEKLKTESSNKNDLLKTIDAWAKRLSKLEE